MKKFVYYFCPRFFKFKMVKQAFQDETWFGTLSIKTSNLDIHYVDFTLDD